MSRDHVRFTGKRCKFYKRLYKELVAFLENASITAERLLFNEYLRAEKLILSTIAIRKFGKITWTAEEKIALAKIAIKFTRWKTNEISTLSWGQIITYANFNAAQTHVSLGPTKKPHKRMTSLDYQREIQRILDEHPNWGKYQILEEMRKQFPKIDRMFVWSLLLRMGLWDGRRPKNGIPWKQWVAKHEGVTWAGDFFSVYVWTEKALLVYDVLFFIHLASLRVVIAGMTYNPTEEWIINILKSWTDGFSPLGADAKFLIRDRDRRYTKNVDWYLAGIGITPIKISAGAPVMNCVAEQFVNNIKRDCLSHCVFFSEDALRKVIAIYVDYYHKYRPNCKFNGDYIMPSTAPRNPQGEIKHKKFLPGILSAYVREN